MEFGDNAGSLLLKLVNLIKEKKIVAEEQAGRSGEVHFGLLLHCPAFLEKDTNPENGSALCKPCRPLTQSQNTECGQDWMTKLFLSARQGTLSSQEA